MLTILNNYQHGFVAIPVVLACKQHGLFELCQQAGWIPFDVLARELRANSGHLQTALHMLASMQWLARDGDRYALTPKSALHRDIPEDITTLFWFPIDDYLTGRNGPHSLQRWVELSGRRWDIQDPMLALFLDGPLMIPLLIALRPRIVADDTGGRGATVLADLNPVAREEILTLFAGKGWLDHAKRPLALGGPTLNDAGRFMIERSLITAAVASYRPMLTNIAEVIFGNCAAVFRRDAAGHESHLDRTLNVIGSGFQHERYFAQMEEIILELFNREPYEAQPRYVADMGCGDGTLLKKIYDIIQAKSRRGKVLDRYPIKLIGIDYNVKALEATARTLHGYDYIVLQGDIGDPTRMIEDLRAQGIADPEKILHVRSFLDHDRPYQPPLDIAAAEARAGIAYHGVYVDRHGNSLPPAVVVQSLVEHLKRWAAIIGNHGLVLLEVHCVAPETVARFIQQSESLHLDAYHRFSQQLLVEADHFIMAAAEAGLFPDWKCFRKHPRRLPFTRITLNYFRKRDYTLRHPTAADVAALVAFEARCLPASQAASAEEIRQRVTQYPEGQCLLEVDGHLAAVAYSQRVPQQDGAAERDATMKATWAHRDDGAVAELLYALCPSPEHKTHGRELIEFMSHWLGLKDGVEVVTGISRCERSLDAAVGGFQGMMATIRQYIQTYPISVQDDTLAAETALSTFGLRWLLRIFQDMGVMATPQQVYTLDDLIRQLGIIPKYERLYAALLRRLERQQVLSITGKRIAVLQGAATFALRDVAAECGRFSAEFAKTHPAFQPFLELMCRCLDQFPGIITGKVAANDVVFPNGSMDVFARIFRGNDVADFFNNLVAELVVANVELILQRAPDARVSILEVGAGTGGTTAAVLERAQHLARSLAFYYTDISSSFTRYGENAFSERFPWVRFARLNIEEDPVSQGFPSESVDIIYASNALHDTRSIVHTLSQVKTLLKPGGLLILNEFTAMKDVLLFTGGLLHGYWLFEDPELRLPDSCLLSAERWKEVLVTSGFQHVEVLGLPFQHTDHRQSVIVGAKAGAMTECPESIPDVTDHGTMARIAEAVREIIGQERMAALASNMPLMEAGLDSMELLELRMLLSKTFAVELEATFLFQHNTLEKVCAFFQQGSQPLQHTHALEPNPPGSHHETAQAAQGERFVPPRLEKSCAEGEIAIIGVALRLPGEVHTLDDFWTLLKHGNTTVGPWPEGRWLWPLDPAAAAEKSYLTQGSFFARIDEFDPTFFRISPREAELMDPQQRLLLELCWEVMEDAGYKPSVLQGSNTGVFIGACHFEYRQLLEEQGLSAEALAATGTSGSILANRLSYFYNLHGPSMLVDTACSSSLMAVHEAVRALRDGSCAQALVGGINLICHAMNTLAYDKAGMLSKDGMCYTFDARANGYVRGEGAALLFLKPLGQALRDHDRIYAVIKGSAANHGGQASSLTAPNPEAQGRLIAKAWQNAGVTAESVTYIEAHGTGTPLGDPIEVEGIRQALAHSHVGDVQGYACGLGSVKANIGHLEGAAGVVGLIKVVLCLQHRMLPKSVNFQQLNPEITLSAPLYIVDETQPWPARRDQAGVALPRRAGISAFGFGGANVHVILEEFAPNASDHPFAGPYLFVLSARNRDRLLAYAERFQAFLERPESETLSLAGMTYTLQHCREEMDERLAILCTDLAQLRDSLQRFCKGQQGMANVYHGNARQSAAEYALLTGGAAGRQFIEALVRHKDYERLALLWIKGARVEWSTLFGHHRPEPMRLPSYPFARERYWVPKTTMQMEASSPSVERLDRALTEPISHSEHRQTAAVYHVGRDGDTLFLTPVWASVSPTSSASTPPLPAATDRVVIAVGQGGHVREPSAIYCQALQQRYPRATLLPVVPEATIDRISRQIEELDSRLGGPVDHIFWIAPGLQSDTASVVQEALVEDQQRGVLPLFRLIKALLRTGYGSRALSWTVLTTRAQAVHRYESVDPTQAGIHGLIGSLAKEFPHWRVRLIDLEESGEADGGDGALPLDVLLALPPEPAGNAWVCRGVTHGAPRWFRQQLVPVTFPAASPSLYRSGGVYVVIGGSGGLGEVWSAYMLRTYGARLVWIGRRPKDKAIQAKLDRLAELGPAPLYLSADAADGAALRRAYEAIKARYGQIHGVVHAAVVLLDQSLANMDEARFRAGLAAKVDTSVRMAQVFQEEALDFVLVFSSIMSFLKAAGQSNYAAGCTFQDAFAHQLGRQWRRSHGGPVVKVINWGYWGEVGVVASKAYRDRMLTAGFGSIDPTEAMAALEALLAGPLDRLALVRTAQPVMTRGATDAPFFNAIDASEQIAIIAERCSPPSAVDKLHQRLGRLPTAAHAVTGARGSAIGAADVPRKHLEDRLLAEVTQATSRALRVDPNDLDVDADLHEYGFDAISLTRMTDLLNERLGLDGCGLNGDVVGRRLAHIPTLRHLAGFLLDEYGEALHAAFPADGVTRIERDIDAWLAKLLWGQLRRAGLLGRDGVTMPAHGLHEFYDRWLHVSLALLVERRFLQDGLPAGVMGEGPVARALPTDVDALWREWDRQKPAWLAHPGQRARVTLVEATLRALPEILAGTRRATDVLFPNGSMHLVEGIYQHHSVADSFNEVLADVAMAYIQELTAAPGRYGASETPRIRILEIGAGTGGTTAMLLGKLRDYRDAIQEYCYTDISKAFLIYGEEKFGRDQPYLTYRLFDVEQPVGVQGIDAGGYDVVIAANVLHATKNIRHTLRNAKACLKAGGLLLLNEISRNTLFYHLTFGLLEGWWRHEDEEWRLSGCPALSPQAWREVLALEGFAPIVFPAREAHHLGQQVIVAASDGVICQRVSHTLTDLPALPRRRPTAADVAPQPAEPHLASSVQAVIRDCLAHSLKTPAADLDGDVPLFEYGLDSILTAGFVADVNNRLGIAMNQAIVFDHTTIDSLTAHVIEVYGAEIARSGKAHTEALQHAPVPVEGGHLPASHRASLLAPATESDAHCAVVNVAAALRDAPPTRTTDIAVIGMSGQFPDAGDVHRLWDNLIAGRECVRELPAHYLDQARYFSAEKQPGKTYSRWGGILQDRDCFDPLFFNIAPREALSMSPHQRLILQESWKALEDAGYNPKALAGERVGVFIGAEPAGYVHETFTGASDAIIASRLSYYLNLRGPAMVVNTGCSSSGVAIHLACESLRHGESSLALAGGVFVLTDAALLVQLCAMDMLSPTGNCHTFDARADGMVVSEGVGVVVLKRLADAVADGDPILGVIQASGVNQDGASNGITAPSGAAQEELITALYQRFQIDPEQISYVEAHGTGTRLGDPVEANALVRAFRRFTDKQAFCAVGSVKAAIGHTAASAGVVGLIKVLLCLKYQTIPGLTSLQQLNPLIEFENTPFYVNTQPQPWLATNGKPRMAAVSSFGHSGTNVHLVIREYRPEPSASPLPVDDTAPVFVPLSARTAERLTVYADTLWRFLSSTAGRDVALADVAHTLQVGREAMKERVIFLVRDIPELVAKLRDFAAGQRSIDGCWVGQAERNGQAWHPLADVEDRRDILTRWVSKGEYSKLAEWWIRGGDLDWSLLNGKGQAAARCPRRISLPTYPFAKERYWATARAGSCPLPHPDSPPGSIDTKFSRERHRSCSLPLGEGTGEGGSQRRSPAGLPSPQPSPGGRGSLHLAPIPPGREEESGPHVAHGMQNGDEHRSPVRAIGNPLPIEDARIAHILADGELLNCDLDDQLCKLLWGTLQSLGVCREETLRVSDFETIAGIEPKYGRWLEESLNILVAMGYLSKGEDNYRVRDPSPVDVEALWREWEDQKALRLREANKKIQIALVDATLRFLPQILTGQRRVTDFLFPDSAMDLVQDVYQHNLVADFFNEAVANILLAYIDQRLRDRSSDAPLGLRLLEIGAGTGGTTVAVLARLDAYAAHLQEYCYTDLSNAFLTHAQRHYAPSRPFLKTRIFNMEAPTGELGVDRSAYDVVIASNAIHAARHVRQALRNAKAVLKPHGLLLLNEISRKPKPLFIHLSLALLDGWWLYEDAELRIPGCPGLYPQTWARVLHEEGFRSVCFPAEKAHVLGQQIVIAESDGGCGQRDAPDHRSRLLHRQPARDLPPFDIDTPGTRLDEHIKATIIESLSESLGVDIGRIDMDEPFAAYGLDSITAVNLVQVLNRAFRFDVTEPALTTTTLFDHSSVNQLAAHILSQYGASCAATFLGQATPPQAHALPMPAPEDRQQTQPAAPTTGPQDRADAIAIIGMSGRFARSETLEAFWQHLITGTDLVEEVSRWDLAPYFPGASPGHRTYCAHGSFLEHIDQFDPLFFKISALEAQYMDPQQRFFLEESWKALEDAGYAGDAVKGRRCGVYVGCVGGDYAKLFREEPPAQAFWGNEGSIIPARIAYYLDLQGPAIAVDTACSSSAVAIHLACQALRSGEIDMALAGGVYIQSTPELYISGSRAGMLSLTGRCFTFDRRADGFVPGEGVGVLVLKRLRDALADGDHLHGVVRGSGINQDGTTNGITAPSAKSQERLIRDVYDRFHINPEHIQMVEAHGTGTILGDPIEVEALTRAFRHYTDREGYCALGTLKTNIGHTSMAAGVAGVLKILLALKHKQIPPSLHYTSANPRISFEHSPFYVNTRPRPWDVGDNATRCAATSAFGFSGTNAHLVIEEAPEVARHHAPRPGYLFVLSARTAEQLRRRVEDLLAFCERQTEVDLGNLCYTLLMGRSHFNHRLACVVRSRTELVGYLRTWLQKGSSLQVYVAEIPEGQHRERASLTRYGNECIRVCRHTDDPGQYLEQLTTIADLYIQGYRLDFAQLFPDGYTKLPLPTYPFARESYWAPAAAVPRPIGTPSPGHEGIPSSPAAMHSLLHRNTSDFTTQRFSSRLSGDEFFLTEHRIDGRQILPGVIQLEMARAAVVAAVSGRDGDGLRLRDIFWPQPLVVDEGIEEVHIELAPEVHGDGHTGEAEQMKYVIYTGCQPSLPPGEGTARERLIHSLGRACLSAPTETPTLDLTALRRRINRNRLSAEQCYEAFRAVGIHHGASLQGLEEVFRSEAEVLARLRPPTAVGDLVLHPTILDAALQASFFLVMDQGDSQIRLPFALAELALFRPRTTPTWAWIRRAGSAGRVDIDLSDDRGNVCIRLKGLSFRASAEKPVVTQAVLLEPCWEKKAAGRRTWRFDRHVVVLCGISNPAPQDIEAELGGCQCLVLPATHRPIEERFQGEAIGIFGVIRELLMQQDGATVLVQVVCPTQGPERLFAALAGLLHIANQENPRLIGQVVEVDAEEDLLARLRESSHSLEEAHIRYLHGKRYGMHWRVLGSAGEEAPAPWKDGATYLITGGLGGLGLVFAREIATRVRDATLFLVGRSPLAGNERVLEGLRALGAGVEYRQVDVAVADQVDALIQGICAHASSRAAGSGIHGPLQGIIHAAGVHADSRIMSKTAAEFAQVLTPKVAGTANLDRATRDLDLDFFVLCSSIAVFMGYPGQADYAAANAFLDAFAAWRNELVTSGQRRGHTLSINWPLWQEGRMRADREIERLFSRRTGLVAMETSVGIHALAQALALGKDQVMVLNGDPSKLYASLSAVRTLPGTARLGVQHTTPPQDGMPDTWTPELRQRAQDYLKRQVAATVQLPVSRIDVDAALERYGFDSILLTKMTNVLEEAFGPLPKTLLFEYQNIRELTGYFLEHFPEHLASLLGLEMRRPQGSAAELAREPTEGIADPVPFLPPAERASVGLDALPLLISEEGSGDGVNHSSPPSQPSPTLGGRRGAVVSPLPLGEGEGGSRNGARRGSQAIETDIAVIGLTGRYPQAHSIAEFWENLKSGKDCVTEIPIHRWDAEAYFDPDPDKPGKTRCKWGGFIDDVDRFDPLFFNISPREAALMDPQERLFLETVWNLLEETGHTRERLQRLYRGKVGVFVGAMYHHYPLLDAEPDRSSAVALSSYSAVANRVSYFFDFQGPSVAIDTMCSSSLTAVHLACESLRRGECVLAVAGGVNLSLHPKKFVGLSRARMAASRPESRSFSDGDGYLPAEGVGAVLLKPLAQAVRDRDDILAVIKSTATNHSGSANGFSVPNPKAQAQLIIDNFERSGIDPRTIGYVESAANGSPLGDAIEVTALKAAFARFTRERGFCAIGSVKSNIGHPEAASGMAQLTKVILQLRYGQLVPSIKASPLNPNISFVDSPFYVQETLCEWQRPRIEVISPDGSRVDREVPRRAAINSFGAGGANAHLILEEYIPEPCTLAKQPLGETAAHLMVFSAKSPERLRAVVRRMLDFLVATDPALVDLAYTLQIGREAMTARLAMVVRDRQELLQGLAAFLEAAESPQGTAVPMFTGDTAEDQGTGDLSTSEAELNELLDERNLEKLALCWTQGAKIPWETLYKGEPPRLIALPTYPFARERYWLAPHGDELSSTDTAESTSEPEIPAGAPREKVRTFLLRFLARELQLTPHQVLPHRDLREYGADSITGMRLIRAVDKAFNIRITGRDLLEHHTLDALSTYLAAKLDAPQAAFLALAPGKGEGEGVGAKNPQQEDLARGEQVLQQAQVVEADALDLFQQGRLTIEEIEALIEQGKLA
ncbi:MAG TPA: SDR family NAD(P)-dependent oxidoreductase [Alphaproteobacteria bacterium]|nr:SDR family NAD(P)-dependent oxidoreductase [Alphaproteobacteria bacterium]